MNTRNIVISSTKKRWMSQLIHQPISPNPRESNVLSIITLRDLGKFRQALQLCIDSNNKDEGFSLHNHLLATGYSPDLHLSTKFIIFYSKFADLMLARKVFDGMPVRSVVSWTAMISGYSQNGFREEALKLFALMHRSGLHANQFTYGSTLQACTRIGDIAVGEQIQGCIEKTQFSSDVFVQSALVDLHLKCGSVEDAWSLFRRMERRDAVSWNSVIGGYAVRGLGDDAFRLFYSMLGDGFLPDHFTLTNVLKACCSMKALVNVNQIHAFVIKLGCGNHPTVTGSLIDAYAKCRRMPSARLVYDSSFKHDLISCTALINGYSLETSSDISEALEIFCEINRMGMQFDDFILCSMLSMCANVASLSLGRHIHACTLKNRPNHDVALGNALIDMYAKAGELEDAQRAFDVMRYRDVISWTSLIAGYAKHGRGKDAVALFDKMQRVGERPNDVTLLNLMFACSHSGLTAKGLDLFNSMERKYGIHPRDEHYSCAVDLLARGGLLQEAYELANDTNVKPSTSLWGSLLGACCVHGDMHLGRIAAGHFLCLDPEKTVNHVVLANIYSAAGLWEHAWNTRKLIDERSVKKLSGCSFV